MSVTLCASFLVKQSNYLCPGITVPYFPSMGKLIHSSESRCFENKMVACFEFNDLKDKESGFFCICEQQPEGKAMFKSKFCHELGEMKQSIYPKVQLMTACNSCRRHLKMAVNHKQQNILLNTTVMP